MGTLSYSPISMFKTNKKWLNNKSISQAGKKTALNNSNHFYNKQHRGITHTIIISTARQGFIHFSLPIFLRQLYFPNNRQWNIFIYKITVFRQQIHRWIIIITKCRRRNLIMSFNVCYSSRLWYLKLLSIHANGMSHAVPSDENLSSILIGRC